MSNLKLGVEVISASDLAPKDGHGSSNPCVELNFDNQKFRTAVKEKDLNPHWNEQFFFNISDPSSLPNLSLEAHVFHVNRNTNSKSVIGKVLISGGSFVPPSEATVLRYPLEKPHIFARSRGELCLKVFLTENLSTRDHNPLPDFDPFSTNPQSESETPIQNSTSAQLKNKRGDFAQTFNHLPREQQRVDFAADGMNSGPPRAVRVDEFQLRETNPLLGGGQVVGGGRVIPAEKPISAYDLVEKVEYLFVRVVKARKLPKKNISGSIDPYVEVRLGNYRGTTKHFEKNQNPEWDEVFAFSGELIHSSSLEVFVKDKDLVKDDIVGMVGFDLHDLPRRAPPDSPLAPAWHWLVGKKGEKMKGEIMLAIWFGTQADECFPNAVISDAVAPNGAFLNSEIRSKVYHSPKLWYVRVNIIEAQDIIMAEKSRSPDVFVKCQLGSQTLKTKPIQARASSSPVWNEDHMFVAAEPFEEPLILSVLDHVSPNKEELIGRVQIHLGSVEKRMEDIAVNSRWYSLEKQGVAAAEEENSNKDKFSSRIHVRICLDGGYHVLDESTHYSSDLRPSARQLWKAPVGLLELGILNVEGLHPMKTREGKGTCDAYCVAKYGQKWVRTRTVINSLSPKYNEQYTWEVYDHGTVLTVGVFDNAQLEKASMKDGRIGKVRIRLSTLETGRVYTHSYPLLVLHSSGLKKMGELHLAVRFSSTSMLNTMFMYSKPLLPKMHYVRPISMLQLDSLRNQAVQIIATRLSRTEPPLRKEVVEYLSDVESHLWSMRRSKANFFRLVSVFSSFLAIGKWFGDVMWWKNPLTTVLAHVLFVALVCFPELILPTIFIYLFLIGIWNYRRRPRHPPHMNTRISCADAVNPDELDEEFDAFPTGRSGEIVKMRYDRLRSVAGRIQTVAGDIATQGERLQAILSWRDPRATILGLVLCLAAAMALYVTPFSVVVVVWGFYVMRHPRFRNKVPSAPVNFFRRLPAKTDLML